MGKPDNLRMRSFIAFLCVFAAIEARANKKETIEWTVPMTPFELCVAPGTDVVFNFQSNHNVDLVGSRLEWENCEGFNDITPVDGPITWTAPSTEGEFFVVCGVGQHCALGQKVVIQTSNSC